MSHKPENLIQYRDETIELVKQSLSNECAPQVNPHPNPAIQSFWDLGTEFRSQGNPGTFT